MIRETMVMELTMAVDFSNFLLILIVISENTGIYIRLYPAYTTLSTNTLHMKLASNPQTATIME